VKDTVFSVSGGALLGGCAAYLGHFALTYGHITILAVVGLVLVMQGKHKEV